MDTKTLRGLIRELLDGEPGTLGVASGTGAPAAGSTTSESECEECRVAESSKPKAGKDAHLDMSKRVRGIERDDYFDRPEASATGWRGGPHTVTKNRKKEADKKAARGRVRDD